MYNMYDNMYNLYDSHKERNQITTKNALKILILLQNYPNFVAKFDDFFKEIFGNFSDKNWLGDLVIIYT